MKDRVHRTARRSLPLWLAALLVGVGSWLQVAPARAATVGWLVMPGSHLATTQTRPITNFPKGSTPSIIPTSTTKTGSTGTVITAEKWPVVIKGASNLLSTANKNHTSASPYIVILGSNGQYTLVHFTGTVTGYTTSGSGSTAQTTVTFTFSLLTNKVFATSCTKTRAGATSECVLPATYLNISSKSLSPAHGTSVGISVLADDVLGQRVRGYTGTVHFTSTSPATLPADYTFTSTDAGFHTFKGVIFPSAGTYSVTVKDTRNPNTLGKRAFNVT